MTWLRTWWRRRCDTTEEALAALAELEERAPRVAELSAELNEAKRRNHFSPMVQAAISRAKEA